MGAGHFDLPYRPCSASNVVGIVRYFNTSSGQKAVT